MAAEKPPRASKNRSEQNGESPADSEPEWSRFESLAGKLVKVPKRALDEKRARKA